MWVKISKPEDTKKLKVGDKVRVEGVEYKVTCTYEPADYGLNVDNILPHGGRVLSHGRVRRFEYTIELWEEEETSMNKKYKIKLKQGDACKIEGLTEEQYHQVCKRFIDSGAAGRCYDASYHRECVEYIEWYYENLCHTNILEHKATIYTYEQIMEDEGKMIERDKEYDLKLTGEQLAILLMLTGSTAGFKGKTEVFERLATLFENNPNRYRYNTHWINALGDYRGEVSKWLDSVFTLPETAQEKKIREMEEKYEALGKAIEQACKEG